MLRSLLLAALLAPAGACLGQMAPPTSPSRPAEPGDFGFPVPSPEPVLPPEVDPFDPPALAPQAGAPAIAEYTRTADRDETVALAGEALAQPSRFFVFGQEKGQPQGLVLEGKLLAADRTAASLLLPETLPAWSTYLVWPERDGRRGRAVAVNRTEAWWLGPDRGPAGRLVSVYGRNLSHANGNETAYVYLKPPGAVGRFVPVHRVNPFKVEFEIPPMPPGTYEVWIHNGHGGRFGWSGPLTLHLLARSLWAGESDPVLDVTSFGAYGNDDQDDSAAIAAALAHAATLAPSTLVFPAGRYLIDTSIAAPPGVTWRGMGRGLTVIRPSRPLTDGILSSVGPGAAFSDMAFVADGKMQGKPLIWLGRTKDVLIRNVSLDAWGGSAFDASDVENLEIDASELIENGSYYGTSRQVFLTDNRFRMTGYGESVVALWGGSNFAMSGNILVNADETREDGHGIGRFFVAQTHNGSMRNLYFGGNRSSNAAPHDCEKVDCNKGEQICFEIVGSKLAPGLVATGPNRARAGSPGDLGKALASGQDLVIVGGRGAGQHRHISSTEGVELTLDAPWSVMPDETSRFALASIASKIAVYDNDFDGRDGYDQHDSDSTGVLLYGNVYDAVVDSNRITRMRHGMMTVALSASEGFSPYFLQYTRNVVSRSNSGLYVGTTFTDAGADGVWGGIGNVYRRNSFSDLAYIGVEFETWDHRGSDFTATVFEANRFSRLPFGFIDAYKLMWTHDGRFKAAPAERPRRINTILRKNRFERGSSGRDGSIGFLTLHPDNSWVDLDNRWSGFSAGNFGPAAGAVLPSPLTKGEAN